MLDSIPRHWRRMLSLVLLPYAAYLLATNILLNTSICKHVINRKPERFHTQRSWTMRLYPDHIQARRRASMDIRSFRSD